MIVYRLDPIDWWNGWHRVEDLFEKQDDPEEGSATKLRTKELWPFLAEAFHAAREWLGWEGDVSDGDLWATVLPPTEGFGWGPDMPFVLAWKQKNNGTTFIASPYRLPWVEQGCFGWVDASQQPVRRHERPAPAQAAA
jgi:hypothetical protein